MMQMIEGARMQGHTSKALRWALFAEKFCLPRLAATCECFIMLHYADMSSSTELVQVHGHPDSQAWNLHNLQRASRNLGIPANIICAPSHASSVNAYTERRPCCLLLCTTYIYVRSSTSSFVSMSQQ